MVVDAAEIGFPTTPGEFRHGHILQCLLNQMLDGWE